MSERRPAPIARSVSTRPRIGLALGGGGARGLAHILVLEALDELGVVPDVISGTSIGAIYGCGYAAGLSGKALRAHTEEMLGQRFDLARQLFNARAAPVAKWLNLLPIRTAFFDAVAVIDAVLPARVPKDFAGLKIPLKVVTTDFYAQEAWVIDSGGLRPAVAASMALPAIFQPVMLGERVLVDGGLVNPLPFDVFGDAADLVIAIDVAGNAGVRPEKVAPPSGIEVLTASSQIFQRSIVTEKLRAKRPDVYIDCPVDDFTVLDFHRFRDILTASAPVKDLVKRQLERVLTSLPIETAPLPLAGPSGSAKKPAGRRPVKRKSKT